MTDVRTKYETLRSEVAADYESNRLHKRFSMWSLLYMRADFEIAWHLNQVARDSASADERLAEADRRMGYGGTR